MDKKMISASLISAGVALVLLSGTMFFVYNFMLMWFVLYLSGFCSLLLGIQVALEK